MARLRVLFVGLCLSTASSIAAAQAPPMMAELRECPLINGARIEPCRVGYRTYGQQNSSASNAILVPSWFGGKSADWGGLLGPGRIIDTTRYHVIVVDALANGVSSSPSTTLGSFPPITIEDMVETQYRLVRDVLGLHHLRAVVGISMGGIQTFEWAAAHPEFVDRFVSIVGSPQMARHDRAWLTTMVRIIDASNRYHIPKDTAWYMLAGVATLVDEVQEVINQRPPAEADSLLAALASSFSGTMNLDDWAAQARAILAYNFGRRSGSDSATVAARLKGRFLVVNSPDDRVVSAGPSLALARWTGLDTLVVRSSCGHAVFNCEATTIGAAVQAFLQR